MRGEDTSCSPVIWRRSSTRSCNFLVNVCAMKWFQPKAFWAGHSSVLLDLYHNVSYRSSVRKLALTFQRGWAVELTYRKVQVTISNTTGNLSSDLPVFCSPHLKDSKRGLQMLWKILKSHLEFTLLEALRRQMWKETTLSPVV